MTGRACIVSLLLAGSLAAQIETGLVLRQIRVRVEGANGVCDLSTHVTLMGRSGPIAEAAANDQCEVVFNSVPAGTYHLKVSSLNFADTDNIISPSIAATDFNVRLKGPDNGVLPNVAPTISAVGLAIPEKARKEFDKSNEMITKQDFAKAIEHLNKALAIYPDYAEAYNNLGVVYARLNDRAHEREALDRALRINDHFAAAYVNLGRMNISGGDFAGAEAALTKAASCDPANAMTLVLLTYSEFMNHRPDAAIASSKLAHRLQGGHAFVHQVAARAYEQKREMAAAVAELQLFLKEEPTGARADGARKELAGLQSSAAPLTAQRPQPPGSSAQ